MSASLPRLYEAAMMQIDPAEIVPHRSMLPIAGVTDGIAGR
jgi:hypothetical protein